jgi:excisionase family DNA binding protein
MSIPTPERLLTVKQVAERLNVSERTVWRLIRNRRIKVRRIGRAVRIRAGDLDDLPDHI